MTHYLVDVALVLATERLLHDAQALARLRKGSSDETVEPLLIAMGGYKSAYKM